MNREEFQGMLNDAVEEAVRRSRQPERFLKIDEACQRLGIGKTFYHEVKYLLIEHGMQTVIVGKKEIRIREASLNKVIKKVSERQINLQPVAG